MLLNKLYVLSSLELSGEKDKIAAYILLNREHPVFKGHFPGNPILPGVCTVQIIRELMEMALEKELLLTKAGNIKYLGFINPVTTSAVQFEVVLKNLETGALSCSALVSAGGTTLCSFKGEYVIFPGSASRILL
jgi:3-hydroxyacyl-[acyl-carrier-protein] dehydratase